MFIEGADGLRIAVFEDGEVVFFQVMDGVAVFVGDSDVNDDKLGMGVNRRRSLRL